MGELLEQIEKVEFITGANFNYDLDREFSLISSALDENLKERLQSDFRQFYQTGRFLVLNTFAGGILFLKVPEPIERIQVEYQTLSNSFKVSVIFSDDKRQIENTKYKPDASKVESQKWNANSIFPNFYRYPRTIKQALLLIIGRLVKRICEHGRSNFAHLNIINGFNIELLIDNQVELKVGVEIG